MPKMTAKRLREEARAYFDGRRCIRPRTQMVPVMAESGGKLLPVLDQYGHQQMEQVECRNAAGETMMETVWYQAPTIAGLCLHLGINKTTFYRWLRYREADGKAQVQLRDAALAVEAEIEDYLTQRSFEKTAGRGAIAQLERRYWSGIQGTQGAGQGQNAVEDEKPMASMADLEAELREMGVLPQKEGDT